MALNRAVILTGSALISLALSRHGRPSFYLCHADGMKLISLYELIEEVSRKGPCDRAVVDLEKFDVFGLLCAAKSDVELTGSLEPVAELDGNASECLPLDLMARHGVCQRQWVLLSDQ